MAPVSGAYHGHKFIRQSLPLTGYNKHASCNCSNQSTDHRSTQAKIKHAMNDMQQKDTA